MSFSQTKFENLIFSPFLQRSSLGTKIAYTSVLTALSAICNTFLEIKFLDTQFSLTITISVLCGIVLGGGSGFIACMIGDFIGYVVNSWGYLYMPWVGISTGAFALLSGIIFHGGKTNGKISIIILKTAITCLATFLICTVGVNSTGFYIYNRITGLSKGVMDFISTYFGGHVTFFAYLAYRLFFKLQILNSVANYALLFVLLPLLFKIDFTKKFFF